MIQVMLVIQIILAVTMIAIILLQKTSSDGLSGLSGGSSSGTGLISGRASANLLTKATLVLGILFMFNSLAMAVIAASQPKATDEIIKSIRSEEIAEEEKVKAKEGEAKNESKNKESDAVIKEDEKKEGDVVKGNIIDDAAAKLQEKKSEELNKKKPEVPIAE